MTRYMALAVKTTSTEGWQRRHLRWPGDGTRREPRGDKGDDVIYGGDGNDFGCSDRR